MLNSAYKWKRPKDIYPCLFVGWQDNVIHTEPEQNEQEGSDQLQLDERAETTESDGCGTLYGLGSTLSLPFCALIAVLKFAMSFLWALRGSRRVSEAVSASITSTTPIDDAQHDGKIVDEHCKSENLEGEIESSAITPGLGSDNNPVLSNEDNNIGPDEDGDETIDNDDAFYNKPKIGEACNFFKSFDSVKDSEDHNFHKESYQVYCPLICSLCVVRTICAWHFCMYSAYQS